MRKIALLAALLLAAGCQTHTAYGQCVGVADQKAPNLNYGVSGRNVFMGMVFSETVIVPAVVVLAELWCPTSSKTPQDEVAKP